MKNISNRFFGVPHPRLGWWSAGLAIVFGVLLIINTTTILLLTNNPPTTRPTALPNLGFPTILCGLAAGIVGLIAVICQQERSWVVWLTLLPGLFVIFLLLGELLVPH